jgi:CRP/FNR family transcriptional regulator, cyclic AMP receptor protein
MRPAAPRSRHRLICLASVPAARLVSCAQSDRLGAPRCGSAFDGANMDTDARTPPQELSNLFAGHTWFTALAAEHQALVLATSHAEYRQPEQFVARRGEPSDWWIGVHSGLIKLAISGATGRNMTLSGVPPGGWFGEGSVIKRELRKYDVETLQRSLVLFVPATTFHALLAASVPFNNFVIHQLNNRMGEFIANIQNARLLDVNARVAQALAQMFNPLLYPNTGRLLAISQEQLGLLAGLSRPHINRVLRVLEEAGIVRVSYNRIEVLDLERLCAYGVEQI